MNTNEAQKQIRIEEYLHSLGYRPGKRQQGDSLWYKSPFRERTEPSFKGEHHSNATYGTILRGQKGGNIIALAQELYASDSLPTSWKGYGAGANNVRPVSFSFGGQPLVKPSFPTVGGGAAFFPAPFPSAAEGINTELAKRECREVRYLTDGKPPLCRRFPNRSGRLRDTQQALQGLHSTEGHHPHTAGTAEGDLLPLRGGFMDYLSFLTLRLEGVPDRPELDGQDYIVLNSTSNLSKGNPTIGRLRKHPLFP